MNRRLARLDGDFYRRSLLTSVAAGLLGALLTAVYVGPALAGRYLLFLTWAIANFALWRYGVREFLGRRRFFILVAAGAAKVSWLAVLMGFCYWLRTASSLGNFLAFLLGFNTPFLVLFLRAVGQAINKGHVPRNLESSGEERLEASERT